MKRSLLIVVASLLLLTSCSALEFSTPTPTPLSITPTFFPTDTPVPPPDPLHLNIIWQFHLPLAPVDPQTGLLMNAQVRLRAINDYTNLALLLQQNPRIKTTISFSPLLLKQLTSITTGTRDVFWELAAHAADDLSAENRQFIIERFFDHSEQQIIATYPRYKELLQQRAAGIAFSMQDIRDLQVWYNLAAFPPQLLSQPPLLDLVNKARDFSEEDKRVLFEHTLAIMRQVNPAFAALQEIGQIELSTSPYAQPILPLLLDTDTARTLSNTMPLPDPPFRSKQDVTEQLKRAGILYQQVYGRAPTGLLPTAGAVASSVTPYIASSGYKWLVSGEEVLARALKREHFTRDASSLVRDADALYRPYQVQNGAGPALTAFFRDSQLSERMETTYATLNPQVAVDDLVTRLQAIRARFRNSQTKGAHLVTLVIDGEAAFSAFPNRGYAFLQALFTRLTQTAQDDEIVPITPSQFLTDFPQALPPITLSAGSWGAQGTTDFSPFIGATENNAAWANLYRARAFLDDYLTGAKIADPTAIARAYDAMLLAESADWLDGHAYADNKRNDSDQQFRDLLGQVYTLVGVPVPVYLQVPIVPPVIISSEVNMRDALTPTIDGIATEGEWNNAGVVQSGPNAQSIVTAFYFGANADSVFFRLDAGDAWSNIARSDDAAASLRVGVYLAQPSGAASARFSRVGGDSEARLSLGMSATHLLEWSFEPDGSAATMLYAAKSAGWSGTATLFTPGAMNGNVLEMSAPAKALGGFTAGASMTLTVAIIRNGQVLAAFPLDGLAQMTMPGAKQEIIASEPSMLSVNDPIGDDTGPGSYTYPTDGVFTHGSYDLKRADINVQDNNLVFKISLNSAIDNVWNSPIGLSIQTVDIYIDKDPGKATGERKLLEGRNASLPRTDGWEYAVWVEGWAQELLMPDGKGSSQIVSDSQVKVEIDPAGVMLIRVPLSALGDGDPKTWGYALVLLSQEAFPSEGVKRVRDVDATASQWRFGGASADTNHTRILDVLIPDGATDSQQALLSRYKPSTEPDMSRLSADDFGIVPLITIQP